MPRSGPLSTRHANRQLASLSPRECIVTISSCCRTATSCIPHDRHLVFHSDVRGVLLRREHASCRRSEQRRPFIHDGGPGAPAPPVPPHFWHVSLRHCEEQNNNSNNDDYNNNLQRITINNNLNNEQVGRSALDVAAIGHNCCLGTALFPGNLCCSPARQGCVNARRNVRTYSSLMRIFENYKSLTLRHSARIHRRRIDFGLAAESMHRRCPGSEPTVQD